MPNRKENLKTYFVIWELMSHFKKTEVCKAPHYVRNLIKCISVSLLYEQISFIFYFLNPTVVKISVLLELLLLFLKWYEQ